MNIDEASPTVSIITITFNNETTLDDTIKSILNQSYKDFEYIIIDGGSTDRTISIIESYRNEMDLKGIPFKFISESDNGIADAWNKGLKLSKGRIIGMLNSDDWFDQHAIKNAVYCLNPEKMELSYGICKRVNEQKQIVENMDVNFNPKRIYLNFGFSFTTCFFTQKLLAHIGNFDTKYRIAIDTDFLLRAIKVTTLIKCNNITYMRLGGVSTKYQSRALSEYQMALKANGYNRGLIFIFGVLKKGYLFLRELRS